LFLFTTYFNVSRYQREKEEKKKRETEKLFYTREWYARAIKLNTRDLLKFLQKKKKAKPNNSISLFINITLIFFYLFFLFGLGLSTTLFLLMKCPSCKTIQKYIMAVVNASPILLLMLIFTWSYWAYNVSLSFSLIQEGHYFQGNITAVRYYLTVDLWYYRMRIYIILSPNIYIMFMELLDCI
jgi:hypothetical protein